MLRSRSFDLVNRRPDGEEQIDKRLPRLKGSYGADLYALEQDRAIRTEPEETCRRRTIRLQRELTESWGFTLQTYGIRNKKTGEIDVMSYVDYIDMHGAAWMSGMRTGDIILSVNGESVETSTHVELVHKIQQCRHEMRLVVLFENCCRKVELHERYLKLKKVLAMKMKELRFLEEEERMVQQGIRLSRVENFRHSNGSSISSEWDIYSAVTSPTTLNETPSNAFAFRDNFNQSELDNRSYDSSTIDSCSESDQWQPNASQEEICAAGPDISMRRENSNSADDISSTRDFEHSYQSDVSEISEASDNGLRRLYNITRCAQRISDAGRSDGILAFDADESMLKADGSMSNLLEDSDIDLKDVKVTTGVERMSSTLSSEQSPATNGKLSFFIESDSEDSIVTSESEPKGVSCDNDGSAPSEMLISEEEKSNVKYAGSDTGDESSGHVSLSKSNVFEESDSVKTDECNHTSTTSETNSFDATSSTSSGTRHGSFLDDDGKVTDQRKHEIKFRARADLFNHSISSSSSSSSSGNCSSIGCSNDSGDRPLPGVDRSMSSSSEKRLIFHPNTSHQPTTSANVKKVYHSHPNMPQPHAKHNEYNVQRSATRVISSSSKRQVKRSNSAGVTPILLSYKKEKNQIDTKPPPYRTNYRNVNDDDTVPPLLKTKANEKQSKENLSMSLIKASEISDNECKALMSQKAHTTSLSSYTSDSSQSDGSICTKSINSDKQPRPSTKTSVVSDSIDAISPNIPPVNNQIPTSTTSDAKSPKSFPETEMKTSSIRHEQMRVSNTNEDSSTTTTTKMGHTLSKTVTTLSTTKPISSMVAQHCKHLVSDHSTQTSVQETKGKALLDTSVTKASRKNNTRSNTSSDRSLTTHGPSDRSGNAENGRFMHGILVNNENLSTRL